MTTIPRKPVIDYSNYIAERTSDFMGREWVFQAINEWLAVPDAARYFIVTGEPGIGKTAIAARLTQLHNLAAAHFCIARQADTLDPLNFTRSISHQLTRADSFVRCLLEEAGIRVEAHINIETNLGQVVGVRIERLIAASTSATTAFAHTVITPLKQLYLDGFEQQLVILVDALDEAVQYQGFENIVDLLANSQGLPLKVRFVLTSRPDSAVLRHFEEQHIPYLTIDAGREENLFDARRYIRVQISKHEVLRAHLTKEGMSPQTFTEKVLSTSHGNFLYLVWTLSAITGKAQKLDSLDILPEGLDGIYREFLRTRAGKNVHQWRAYYRPLLGILAVAQAPLTVEQLMQFIGLGKQALKDSLQDIEQFLDPVLRRQKRYQMYHQSIADFIGSEERAQEFWVELESMHKQIATSYRERYAPQWHGCDPYGLLYLPTHLIEAKQFEVLQGLLLAPGWLDAQRSYDPALQAYIKSVERVLEMVEIQGIEGLPGAVAWSLNYGTVISQATSLPITALEAMTVIDEIEQALHYADLLTEPHKKALAYLKIGMQLQTQGLMLQAQEVLARVQALTKHITRENWRVKVLSDIVQALIIAGDQEQAHQTMKDALAVAGGIADERLRIETLCSLVEGLIQLGSTAHAQNILKQALSMAKETQDFWILDHVFQTIDQVEGVGDKNQIINDVLATLDGITDEQEFVTKTRLAAQWLIKMGRVEQAADILNRATNLLQDFDDQGDRDSNLEYLIPELAKIGAYDQALLLAQDIDAERERSLALGSVATALSEVEAFDRALTIAENIEEEWVQAETLREIAQTLAKTGAFERALVVADNIYNDLERARALGAIALALARKKEIEQARRLLARTRSMIKFSDDRVHQAQALGEIALALAGDQEQALQIGSQSLRVAKSIDYEWYRIEALSNIALVMAQAGLTELADQAIGEALEDVEKVNKEFRSSVLSHIARTQALTGARDQARQTIDRALHMAEMMRSHFERVRALNDIAECLKELGEVEQARQILYKALSVAGHIRSRDHRAWALSEVSIALIDVGEAEQAHQTLAEALPLATGHDRPLSYVALGFAQVGEVDRGLTIASEVNSKHEASIALHGVVQTLLHERKFNQALAVTNSMIDDLFGHRARALCDVAEYLIKVKDIKQAYQVLVRAMTTAENIEVEDWRPDALKDVSQTLIQILKAEDTEIVHLLMTAFRAARNRGREEVWLHVEAFAKVLGKLGVIENVWSRIQEVEILWKG